MNPYQSLINKTRDKLVTEAMKDLGSEITYETIFEDELRAFATALLATVPKSPIPCTCAGCEYIKSFNPDKCPFWEWRFRIGFPSIIGCIHGKPVEKKE